METDGLVIQIKSLDFHNNIAKHIETRCDLSSYEEKKKIFITNWKKEKKLFN